MPRPLRLASVAVALLAALPAAAAAQTRPAADSLPVRAGTWAAEGGISGLSNGADAGLLRFFGTRSALTLQVNGQRASFDQETAGMSAREQSTTILSGTIGWRRYGTMRRGIAPFGGLGALVGSRIDDSETVDRSSLDVGGYGEIGAAYLVADRLTINASTGLRVQRSSFGNGPTDFTETRTTLGGVRLAVTLFF